MGEPLNRKNRVFAGPLKSFDEVFPELEDVTVEYTEFELAQQKKRGGVFSVRSQGGQMRCGNSACFRGGHEFDFMIQDMVRNHETQREIELHCKGDEGTPKRRGGRSCNRYIKGVITIKPKQV
jgi:hypothetical protein